MYQILVRVIGRYAPIVTLPVAIVLGFVGYTIESHFSSKSTPYLETSINEERDKRLIDEINKSSQAANVEAKSKNIFDKNDPKKLISH